MAGLPIKTRLDYYAGDSLSGIEVVWEDSQGVPIDLTDYLASLQVKDSSGTILLHLDSDTETGLTIDEENGKVIVNATATKMAEADFEPGSIYDYDIQVKSDNEETIRTLMFGKFVVHEQITQV